MKNWLPVKDDDVRNVWVCPECKDTCEISPDWYQDNGTPMCCECDDDMEYSHTIVADCTNGAMGDNPEVACIEIEIKTPK